MGVQRLLRLRMASHPCPAAVAPRSAFPLSSFLLAPSPAAARPRSAPLSCAAQPCRGHAAGRRFPGVAAMSSSTPPPVPVRKSEEEWQAILTPEQFNILRRKGTEYPGTGEYDKFFDEGIYKCAGCGTPLYKSSTKFNSGCGWPAFYEGLPGAIRQTMVGNYRVYKEQKDLYAMYCQEKPSSGRRQLCHMCISEQNYFDNKFLPNEMLKHCCQKHKAGIECTEPGCGVRVPTEEQRALHINFCHILPAGWWDWKEYKELDK